MSGFLDMGSHKSQPDHIGDSQLRQMKATALGRPLRFNFEHAFRCFPEDDGNN
jgi:hypothetical protein